MPVAGAQLGSLAVVVADFSNQEAATERTLIPVIFYPQLYKTSSTQTSLKPEPSVPQ